VMLMPRKWRARPPLVNTKDLARKKGNEDIVDSLVGDRDDQVIDVNSNPHTAIGGVLPVRGKRNFYKFSHQNCGGSRACKILQKFR
jgi:hypothetical protein